MISIRKGVKSSSNTAFEAGMDSGSVSDFGGGHLLYHQTLKHGTIQEKTLKNKFSTG